MTTITLSEILNGTKAGRLQAVGLMQLIPLVKNETGTALVLASLGELQVSNRNYGSIRFRNPTDFDMVVPRDSAFLTTRDAQDHAVPKVVIVGATSQVEITEAACIQETTGGYIIEGDHEMIILPFALREQSYHSRKESSYQKLWGTIRDYNTSLGLKNTGHIEVFLNAYRKQMQQFVAEFEPVPGQVGAVVMIAGRIVGIERVPTEEYWLEIWETMIRDCYGSLAIYVEKTEQDPPTSRFPIIGDPETLEDLKAALKETEEVERNAVRDGIDQLLDQPLEIKETEKNGRYHVHTLDGSGFIGQSVNDNGNVIYASLIADREHLRQTRSAVDAFSF